MSAFRHAVPKRRGFFLMYLVAALTAAATMLLLVPSGASGAAQILPGHDPLADVDARAGSVAPTSEQLAIVERLGAEARWNRFGTPQSLVKWGGYLATGLGGEPAAAAREWIRANKELFRLSDAGVDRLEVLNDSKLAGSEAHAVLFRQRFGELPAVQDGLITVGVVDGKVAYASSSAAGDGGDPGAAKLSPLEAWTRAAANVGRTVSVDALSDVRTEHGWTVFRAPDLAGDQRSRLAAFPTPKDGVRAAYETVVLDADTADAEAYTVVVDAQSGEVLFRQNRVERLASTHPFTGEYTPTACGKPNGPYTAPAGTKTIEVVATATIPTNDIVLRLLHGGKVVASQDILFSPEALHYEPQGGVPAGDYFVEVCPFNQEQTPPTTYAGAITINDVLGTGDVTAAVTSTPKWKVFQANPSLDYGNDDTRVFACWLQSLDQLTPADAECQWAVANIASRAPWDYDPRTNAPSLTTKGNNANTGEAWTSPFTPGAFQQRPVAPDRRYAPPWTNAWFTSKCDPKQLVPGGNDVLAAATNLFAMHNRMHDWSYFLGFDEVNSNAQDSNFGNTDPRREHDPETGDVQAGALTGGAPSYLGRDNANQITLNDGIPPITNMYLWQPIAAGFYAPCVDGDFDMSVIGHEYTHLISNRMVAGPDAGLSGYQAGAMGESWSDLGAVEYLAENGFAPTNDENPFAVGPYVTGNGKSGIRNYGMNDSPLNYSDLGYDVTGPQVHADGEIWSATNYDIRQALVEKYDGSHPASDKALQLACADGKRSPDTCPGNRRWIQLVYDAWLLMPSTTTMLDARDAMLAADVMRFGGANQKELWHAFATRGMGSAAVTAGVNDSEATPSFESPLEPAGTLRFRVVDEGGKDVVAQVFVGHYEARAAPIADTDGATELSDSAKLVAGEYDFVVRAPGHGALRLTRDVKANQTAQVKVELPANLASKSNGATATASSVLSDGAGDAAVNAIDDTEATQWSGTGQRSAPQTITIDLAGTAPVDVRQVNVSAMLRSGQNRFTALRQFTLQASTDGTSFTDVYTSPADAFPSVAPRPVAPTLILRRFDLPKAAKATHLRLVAVKNQCQGGPAYQGDQDADPLNNSDCVSGNPTQADRIRVAEVQVFATPQKQ